MPSCPEITLAFVITKPRPSILPDILIISAHRCLRVQLHGLKNERLECDLIYSFAVAEVDGANRFAVQAGIEDFLRVLELSTLWEGQPHRALECIGYTDDSIVRPDRDSRWPGRFFPLHFFNYGGIGFLDQGAQR
jgi:hypothetical protein